MVFSKSPEVKKISANNDSVHSSPGRERSRQRAKLIRENRKNGVDTVNPIAKQKRQSANNCAGGKRSGIDFNVSADKIRANVAKAAAKKMTVDPEMVDVSITGSNAEDVAEPACTDEISVSICNSATEPACTDEVSVLNELTSADEASVSNELKSADEACVDAETLDKVAVMLEPACLEKKVELENAENGLETSRQGDDWNGRVKSIVEKVVRDTEGKWHKRIQEKQEQYQESIVEMRKEMDEIVKQSAAVADIEINKREGDIQELKKQCVDMEKRCIQVNAEKESMKKELENVQHRVEGMEMDKNLSSSSFWEKTTDLSKQNRVLEDENTHLKTDLLQLEAKLKSMKKECSSIREQESEKLQQNGQMDVQLTQYKTAAMVLQQSMENEKQISKNMQNQNDALQQENTALYAQLVALQSERSNRIASGVSVIDVNEKVTANVAQDRTVSTSSQDDQIVATLKDKIATLKNKILDGEKVRRKMHNTIQELRGNVRVNVRIRPFLKSDNAASSTPSAVNCDALGYSVAVSNHSFSFDKVFGQTCGQEDVFNEVSEFIQSSMDGYNVCIFAYGQTGAGKSFTMQGSGNGQMRGLIPRSIEQIMQTRTVLETQGWSFQLEISYLEVYNENLRDLLVAKPDTKLNIRQNKRGQNYVDGAVRMKVDNADELQSIIDKAAYNRSVAFTDMNAQSSRSHSVFMLHLKGHNSIQNVDLTGSLNLVDLAGSERLSRSNATGERLKEAQAINKSLSSLADVFVAIGKKSSHIPYRNSKLTQVLQPSLSGDGKTLMMVNVSPTEDSINESVCSLRFAKLVNQCELGTATRQVGSKK